MQELKYEENSVKAVQCLNDMVTNALSHVEDCLTYMSALRDPSIFRFCAIPQVCCFDISTDCMLFRIHNKIMFFLSFMLEIY